jgi:predicted porin
MKKSLLAVAAIGAFASAAQAQSSVTVYGILDVGYIGSNIKEVAANGVTTKQQNSAFGQSAEASSRLGFKGTEDLGGGKSAFFTVEMGLNPQGPDLMSSSTSVDAFQRNTNNAGTGVNNRQSFVGLKQNGIGQFAFGRQYTPVFDIMTATNPGANNNIVGSTTYPTAGNAASSGNGNGAAFTNRASNALTVMSDSFGGFRAGGMYSLNNKNDTQSATAGGNTNINAWGLKADFTWKKLYVGAAYQSFKTAYSNTVNDTASVLNPGTSTSTGVDGGAAAPLFGAAQISDKQTFVGATYDFGILKAYAQWVGRKIQNDTANAAAVGVSGVTVTGSQLNRNAQQIGVRAAITPVITSWASIGTGKYKGPITSAGEAASVNFLGWQVGSDYALSKRTNLYAIYGQSQSTSGTSTAAGAGSSANQYALGVKHTF